MSRGRDWGTAPKMRTPDHAFDPHTRRIRSETVLAFRWFLLVAIWLHLGAVATSLVAGRRARVHPHTPPVERARPIELLRLDPDGLPPPAAELEELLTKLDPQSVDDRDLDRLSPAELEQLLALDPELLLAFQVDPRRLEKRLLDEKSDPPEDPPDPLLRPSWEEFVHTEASDAVAESQPDARFISAHNTAATEQTRTMVHGPERGATLARDEGQEYLPASPHAAARTGRDETTEATPDRVTKEVRGASASQGGGGIRGGRQGEASRDDQGQDEDGGEARPEASARAAAVSVSGGTSGAPRGAQPDRPLPDATPEWQPIAARVIVVRAPDKPAEVDQPESPETPESGRSASANVGGDPGEGGAKKTETEPEVDAPEDHAEDGLTQVDAEGTEDLVEDVRESMGWQPREHRNEQERAATLGFAGSEGGRARSEQTVLPEEFEISDVVRVHANATELGKYMEQVDRVLAERWGEQDLEVHAKAIGIQGQVVVETHIHRSGRVLDVRVVSSSGHPQLDEMARATIPRRLPRFPTELALEALTHRVTLRYRNDLIRPLDVGN